MSQYCFLVLSCSLMVLGWIYAGDARQDYDINVVDNVLVALFAVVGDGLAPFRLVDTYHMAVRFRDIPTSYLFRSQDTVHCPLSSIYVENPTTQRHGCPSRSKRSTCAG